MKRFIIYFLFIAALFTFFVSVIRMQKSKQTAIIQKQSQEVAMSNQFPAEGYVRDFDISPDGTKLVAEIAKINGEESSVDLWLMDSDGNNKKRLTFTEFDLKTQNANKLFRAKNQMKVPYFEQVFAVKPKFLPDGKHIAYYLQTDTLTPPVSGEKSYSQPRIVDLEGKPAFENLPCNGRNVQLSHPVFSPDMKHYAYAKEIKYNNSWANQVNIGDLQTGSEITLEQLFSIFGSPMEFIWSPDGEKIAVSGKEYSDDKEFSNSSISYLWIYDIFSKELKRMAKIGGYEKTIKWSVDSKVIVAWNILNQTNAVEDNGTWLLSFSREVYCQVGRGRGVYHPVWSLNNKNIALRGGFYNDLKSLGIYIADTDGKIVNQIISGMRVGNFNWVLRDCYIIYSKNLIDENKKFKYCYLWMVSTDGKSNESLDVKIEYDYHWKYSSSAEQIFYINQIKERNGDVGVGINWDNLWSFDLKTRQKKNITNLKFPEK